MGLVDRLKEWIAEERANWAYAMCVAHHRRAGHPTPHIAAHHEFLIRWKLESLRDFVSQAVREGREAMDAKAEWRADHLGRFRKLNGSTLWTTLRNAVDNMPIEELLHRDALAIHRQRVHRDVEEAEARAKADKAFRARARYVMGGGPWAPEPDCSDAASAVVREAAREEIAAGRLTPGMLDIPEIREGMPPEWIEELEQHRERTPRLPAPAPALEDRRAIVLDTVRR